MDKVGPILDLSGDSIRSVEPKSRTIALTFDDGPNPRWTPQILDVLARYDVPATFFVIGSHAADHPGIVRREFSAGHDIGNHTFTHVNLARVADWRARFEVRLTEVSLAAATGHHTVLLRPPYSSDASAVGLTTLRAWQKLGQQGYLIVLSTLDADDWQRGVTTDQIVQRVTPPGSSGAIVLMHDGGGDRRHTVAALEVLIPKLKARGYRFVTVGEMAHLNRDIMMPSASTPERLQSKALRLTLRSGEYLADAFTVMALLIAGLALMRLFLLVLFARRHARGLPGFDDAFAPSVTILVPAYNEEVGIEASVRSLGNQHEPAREVIVIDYGSTDETATIVARLIDEGLDGVSLIRRANAGKSNALNAGLQVATGEIIVTVDADTAFVPDTLGFLVQPFRDARVGAVSGNTKVANRGRLLGRWQHLEYVMGFNLDRRMYDRLGCMPTVPGAIGAFRRGALDSVGGFSDDTLAEDTDLTMALHRADWAVVYEPRAIAWTEAPQGLRDLWRQRYRWSYGTIQSIWKHRRAVVEGGPSRRLGWIGLPYLVLFQILLAALGPVVDLFALYGVVFLDRKLILIYWLGFMVLQMAAAIYALRLDHERLRDAWSLPLQQIVYRQLMYLVVIQSLATALSGARTNWHKLRRTGALAQTRST